MTQSGVAKEAFEALDHGETAATLDSLLEQLAGADEETREQLRRAIAGILASLDPATIRHRLAAALY